MESTWTRTIIPGTGKPTSCSPTAAPSTCDRSRPDDADRLVGFHARLSERTRYFRYFGPYPRMPAARPGAVQHGRPPRPRGLRGDARRRHHRRGPLRPARRATGESAEVAFVVEDDAPGPRAGLDPAGAPGRGGARERADAGSSPRCSPRTARWCGCSATPATPSTRAFDDGSLHLDFAIAADRARPRRWRAPASRRAEARSRSQRLLTPRSVAVDRRVAPTTARSGTRCWRTCCGRTSPARSTRSTPSPVGARRAGLPVRARHPRTTSTSPSSPFRRRRSPSASTPCRPRACTALVVVSGGFGETGDGGADGPARAGRRGPRARHAGGRPELPRRRQHRSRRSGSTPPSPRSCRRPRPGRLLLPVRRARASRSSATRARRAASACRRSSRRATAPTSPATTCCSTGHDDPAHRGGAAVPGVASATRASSPGWPGGWPRSKPVVAVKTGRHAVNPGLAARRCRCRRGQRAAAVRRRPG